MSGDYPARKVSLDTLLYDPKTGDHHGGDSHCDHDYPPESKSEDGWRVRWECRKCGSRLSFERWRP